MRQIAMTIMSRLALIATLLGLVHLAACAPPPPSQPSSPVESFSRRYNGKTVLFYERSHGNQIEYYDPGGGAFLWYPGNSRVVSGDWRPDDRGICLRYGANTYNAVTHEHGGAWGCATSESLDSDVVDSAQGDVFGLATGNIPYELPAQPRFGSIADVKGEI
jgi:hypothetical protein